MFFFPWYPAMMLAVESGQVIDLRLWKIARGGEAGAQESRLMVKEKIDALLEAGSLLLGGASSSAVIDMYRQHVASNVARLK
jgi:hypothetical protein